MKPSREPAGSVLIFTLWLASALAAAALLVAHTGMLHYRREANLEARLHADHAIDGALRYVQQVLTSVGTPGILPDAANYQAENLRIGDCRVWLLGRSDDLTADAPVFALSDENGKLNLNTATQDMLQVLPGMTVDLAGAIVDWRDPDSDISANGAESDAYLALNPPYQAKNAPFESVDELRLLRGATAALLDGRDRNRNTLLEPWERTLAESEQKQVTTVPDIGILDHVTVHSREPNTVSGGSAKTDLNGSPQAVRQALNELFGTSRGTETATAAGLAPGVRFSSVLQFCVKAKLTDAEAGQAWDRFTVTTGSTPIRGRVNANTAGSAVLACLPGIGEDNAAKLVSYRKQNSSNLTSPLWVVSAVGETAALTAAPYLTFRSYQVTADIVAVAPHGRGFRRVRFVLDTTGTTPVVISRRDLSHFGWPLGDALHESINRQDRQDGSST